MQDDGTKPSSDEATGLEDFTYSTSLNGTNPVRIRLLTLSRSETRDEPGSIRCILTEHNFDERCPDYEALSYAWGDATERTSILCNDKNFYVTKQLARALYALRDIDRCLWIDQICINQADDLEKTVQVRIMNQIYRRSTTTIAWLDDQRSMVREAFEVISRIKAAADQDVDPETAQKIAAAGAHLNEDPSPSVETDEDYVALLKILNLRYGPVSWYETVSIAELTTNAWFSRRWIIQEATLCTNLLVINAEFEGESQCRNIRSCSFEDLLLTVGICLMNTYARRRGVHFDPMKRLLTLAFIRGKYAQSQILDFDLVQLLVMCRFFHNTDPRDRLFSLCGFSSDRSDLARIDPDYVAPAAEVLATSIHQLMKSENNLRLLEMSECSRRFDGIPSWIAYDRTIKDPDHLAYSDIRDLDLHNTKETILQLLRLGGESNDKEEDAVDDAYKDSIISSEQTTQDIQRPPHADTHAADEISVIKKIGMLELEDGLTLHVRGRMIDRIACVGPVILNPATSITIGFGQADPEDMIRGIEELERQSEARLKSNRYATEFVEILRTTIGIIGLANSVWHRYFDSIAEMDAMVMKRRGGFAYPTGEDLMTVYRTTLCGGNNLEESMFDHERDRAFRRWRRALSGPQSLLNSIRAFFHVPRRVGGFAGTIVILVSLLLGFIFNNRKMNYLRASLGVYGRRLAWTENGLLALVPSRSTKGDVVVALDGAKLPFVLSPTGSEWEMVGPAYVHGLMGSRELREGLDQDIRII